MAAIAAPMTADQAKQALERSKAALSNLRAKAATAAGHMSAAAGAAGHELLGFATLGGVAWASGYWGSDYITFWGIDFRPVIGAALGLAGLAAILFGMPSGRYGLSLGRGFVGAWLAEGAASMGAQRRTNVAGVGALPDYGTPNHAMHDHVQVSRAQPSWAT